MDKFTKPLEDLSKSAKEYVDLRIDDIKLRTAKGLSLSLSQTLAMVLILSLLSVVFLAIAFGLILLIGQLIGSFAGSAFLVAGIFLLAALILFKFKNKMFVKQFVRLFINVFFEDNEEGGENE